MGDGGTTGPSVSARSPVSHSLDEVGRVWPPEGLCTGVSEFILTVRVRLIPEFRLRECPGSPVVNCMVQDGVVRGEESTRFCVLGPEVSRSGLMCGLIQIRYIYIPTTDIDFIFLFWRDQNDTQ